MNHYLTEKREDEVYKGVTDVFEKKYGECTNCESNYVTEDYNYFEMWSEEGCFVVKFKTKNSRLLKKSVTFKKL